jgi:endonuclease III
MLKNHPELPEPSQMLVRKAASVSSLLFEAFGTPDWGKPLPVLDELVSTILSQNTNDRNRDRAFQNLKKTYPTWEAVRDAPLFEIIDAIRSAGLANQKGQRIQSILQQVTAERGTLNTDFLHQLPPDEIYTWLLKFKGVGPKTTAIVMQFSLGIPAFPVDTHIYRVSGRLGLRPQKITVEEAHFHLAQLFPPQLYGMVHLNLIRIGREVCHPRLPECSHCPLHTVCDYALGLKERAG